MIEGVVMALVALSVVVFCAVVVPAFFFRRSSRRDPAGRAYRLASGALRLGWRVVLVALLSSTAIVAVVNPLGQHGTP